MPPGSLLIFLAVQAGAAWEGRLGAEIRGEDMSLLKDFHEFIDEANSKTAEALVLLRLKSEDIRRILDDMGEIYNDRTSADMSDLHKSRQVIKKALARAASDAEQSIRKAVQHRGPSRRPETTS